jgi:hypothetical protein
LQEVASARDGGRWRAAMKEKLLDGSVMLVAWWKLKFRDF